MHCKILNKRKGSLDPLKLRHYGLARQWILDQDALFFVQLLLLMYDANKSGIKEDNRKLYCSSMETYSNIYASKIQAISSYGHSFQPTIVEDLIHFDRVIRRDSCIGSGDRDLYYW